MFENDDTTDDTAPPVNDTPVSTLDPRIVAVLNDWWSAVVRTMGPQISTTAFNALSAEKDNLIDQLTAVLR